MTTIYVLSDVQDGEGRAYPTLAAARAARTEYGLPSDSNIIRFVIQDMPLRERLCALYNRQQFAKDSKLIR